MCSFCLLGAVKHKLSGNLGERKLAVCEVSQEDTHSVFLLYFQVGWTWPGSRDGRGQLCCVQIGVAVVSSG